MDVLDAILERGAEQLPILVLGLRLVQVVGTVKALTTGPKRLKIA